MRNGDCRHWKASATRWLARYRCDAPCAWEGVGVVAGTWAWFFPPAHPEMSLILGDTPWNPRQRGEPLCTPPGLRKVILLMAIGLGHEKSSLSGVLAVGRRINPATTKQPRGASDLTACPYHR